MLSGLSGLSGLGGIMRSSGGWTDPLAGIPFALRLQTHRGDNVPLGLYQDTTCTIPATADGHSVAAWRDELSGSGLIATQSNAMKQPTLRFVDGVPVLRFDGVDDELLATIAEPDASYWSIALRQDDTNNRVPLGAGDNGAHTIFYNGTGVFFSGQQVNAGATMTDWNVLQGLRGVGRVSVYLNGVLIESASATVNPPNSSIYIGSWLSTFHFAGDFAAVMISSGHQPEIAAAMNELIP